MEEKKEVNVYDEMKSPLEEVRQTLPIEEKAFEEELPTPEKRDYLDDLPNQQQKNQKQFSQPMMFNEEGKENLIENLLKVDWERIEHIIRGHRPKVDDEGNEYFVKIKEHYLNEYGVNAILHYLSFYMSKEIKLGRYSIEKFK